MTPALDIAPLVRAQLRRARRDAAKLGALVAVVALVTIGLLRLFAPALSPLLR